MDKIIEQKIENLEKRVAALEEKLPREAVFSEPLVKKMSAKEFLMTKNPKTDTQKTLALAYYLEYINGMHSFNVADLGAAFSLAKEQHPANINDAVNKNITRGFLMEATEKRGGKKAWILTATGEKYVGDNLNK